MKRWIALALILASCSKKEPPRVEAQDAAPAIELSGGCAGLRVCGEAITKSSIPMGHKLGKAMVGSAESGLETHCNQELAMRVASLKSDLYRLPEACAYDAAALAQKHNFTLPDPGPPVTPCARLRACGLALEKSSLPQAIATMGPDLVKLAEAQTNPLDVLCIRSLKALETEVKTEELPGECL